MFAEVGMTGPVAYCLEVGMTGPVILLMQGRAGRTPLPGRDDRPGHPFDARARGPHAPTLDCYWLLFPLPSAQCISASGLLLTPNG